MVHAQRAGLPCLLTVNDRTGCTWLPLGVGALEDLLAALPFAHAWPGLRRQAPTSLTRSLSLMGLLIAP